MMHPGGLNFYCWYGLYGWIF